MGSVSPVGVSSDGTVDLDPGVLTYDFTFGVHDATPPPTVRDRATIVQAFTVIS